MSTIAPIQGLDGRTLRYDDEVPEEPQSLTGEALPEPPEPRMEKPHPSSPEIPRSKPTPKTPVPVSRGVLPKNSPQGTDVGTRPEPAAQKPFAPRKPELDVETRPDLLSPIHVPHVTPGAAPSPSPEQIQRIKDYVSTMRFDRFTELADKHGIDWNNDPDADLKLIDVLVNPENDPFKEEVEVPQWDEDLRATPQEIQQYMRLTKGKASPLQITGGSVLPNAKVSIIDVDADGAVTIKVDHPAVKNCERTLNRDHDGNVWIYNELIKVNTKGQGLGTDMFASQVAWAVKAGVQSIACHAAGSPENPKANGFYTWPRLGYDQAISDFDPDFQRIIREKFPTAKSVLDIFMTKEGREWWGGKKDANGKIIPRTGHGKELWNAKFDLTPGSRSLQVLEDYLREYGKRMPTANSSTKNPIYPPNRKPLLNERKPSGSRNTGNVSTGKPRPGNFDCQSLTGSPMVFYKAEKAPQGGVTIGGKFFAGGQFIPSEVMAKATEEERQAVHSGESRGKPLPPEVAAKAAPEGKGKPAPKVEQKLPPTKTRDYREVQNELLNTPFETSRGLSQDDAKLEQWSQQFARENYTQLRDLYLRGDPQRGLPANGVFGPDGDLKSVTLNTDEWRALIPGYTGANSAAVHEASSWLNKMLYAETLELQKGKGNQRLMILAGGGGSGKGTATTDYFTQADYPLVLDQVSDNLKKLESRLDEATQAGFTPEYVFVDRPPLDAAGGIVGRAINLRKKGKPARTVPLEHGLRANIAARKTALELLRKRPDIEPLVIDNRSGSWGQRRLITDRGEAITHLESRLAEDEAALASGLAHQIREDLLNRHRMGDVPEDLMAGFLGPDWRQPISASQFEPERAPERRSSPATHSRWLPSPGSGRLPS